MEPIIHISSLNVPYKVDTPFTGRLSYNLEPRGGNRGLPFTGRLSYPWDISNSSFVAIFSDLSLTWFYC